MPIGPQDPARGVLDFPRALQTFHLDRVPASPALALWVETYWEVVWDLSPGQAHRQTNLSHAAVNLAVEPDGSWVYGVPGPIFLREIAGQGRVFGLRFHPGAFFPWFQRPVKDLFDRRVPLAGVFGPEVGPWERAIEAEPDFGRRVALSDEFWAGRRPGPPGEGARAARILAEDRSLLKVEDACRRLGVDRRTLERVFAREVGLGPKDVIRRLRLMESAERLAREPQLSGLELALDLGYADQAHFIRDFRAVVGTPPEAYRKRLGRQPAQPGSP